MVAPRLRTDELAPEPGPRKRGPRRTPARLTTPAEAATDIATLRTQLLATVAEHYPQADLTQIGNAFDLAVEAHTGQKRATGEDYVTHPIATAQALATRCRDLW